MVPPSLHGGRFFLVRVDLRHVCEGVVALAAFVIGNDLAVGRVVAHPSDVLPTHLAGGVENENGVPMHGGHGHHVALGLPQPQHGGRELAFRRLVGRAGGHCHAHGRQLVFDGVYDFLAVVGFMVDDADVLLAFILNEVAHRGTDLIVVDATLGELHGMERLHHLPPTADGEEVRHPHLELLRHDGIVHRRAHRQQHGEDVVPIDELVSGLDGLRQLVVGVLHHKADQPPMHAPFGVRLIEAHARAIGATDPPNGHGAG